VYKSVDKYDIKVVSWYQNLGVFSSSRCGVGFYFVANRTSPNRLFIYYQNHYGIATYAFFIRFEHVLSISEYILIRVFVILGIKKVSSDTPKFIGYVLPNSIGIYRNMG
jgi:hypothetical protein